MMLMCDEATMAHVVLPNWIHLSKKTQPWAFVLLKGDFLRLWNVFLSLSKRRVSGCAAGIAVLSMKMERGAALSQRGKMDQNRREIPPSHSWEPSRSPWKNWISALSWCSSPNWRQLPFNYYIDIVWQLLPAGGSRTELHRIDFPNRITQTMCRADSWGELHWLWFILGCS